MKGIAIVVWLALAGITSIALFQITFKVEHLEARLSELNKEMLAEQQAVHVLKAEWSFLTRPSRIEELSRTHLPELNQLGAAQIQSIDDLPVPSGAAENEPAAVPAAVPARLPQ